MHHDMHHDTEPVETYVVGHDSPVDRLLWRALMVVAIIALCVFTALAVTLGRGYNRAENALENLGNQLETELPGDV